VAHIDDLIEPSPEKIPLPAVPTLLRPHRESLPAASPTTENHAPKANSIWRIAALSTTQFGKNKSFKINANPDSQAVSGFFTDD
jgi:hypothetical protein